MRPPSIPTRVICYHISTLSPSTRWELTDNGMVGFDGRFTVRCEVAGVVVSLEEFNRETRAREIFERKVQQHYE